MGIVEGDALGETTLAMPSLHSAWGPSARTHFAQTGFTSMVHMHEA
jgi:hypothetical protein